MRNLKYLQETIFKSILNSSIFFTAEGVGAKFRDMNFEQELNDHNFSDPELAKELLLNFKFEDLQDTKSMNSVLQERLEQAINHELIQAETKSGSAKENHFEKIENIKDFYTNELEISDKLREKIKKYKEKTFIAQNSYMGILTAAVPFLTLIFRKYALGVDRFTGSMHYLSKDDDKKLGNKGIFTKTQILGTIAAGSVAPILTRLGLHILNNSSEENEPKLIKNLRSQLNPDLGLFPKQGAIALFTAIPHWISKLSNFQGVLEFAEDILKMSITLGSLLLGDRVTNGRLAKIEDDKLVNEFNTEPGILYYRDTDNADSKFPEQADYQHIKEKTKDNPELEGEVIKRTANVFARGFAEHAVFTFFSKLGVNSLIRQLSKVLLKN